MAREENKNESESFPDKPLTHPKSPDQERRYRWLFESLGEAAGLVDEEERFTLANPAAEEIFGVSPNTLIGRSLVEFLSPEARKKVMSQTERRRRRQRDTYELDVHREDGTERTILVTATPIYSQSGKYEGALGVFRDITEIKKDKKKLEESEREKQIILDSLHEGISYHDTNLRIKWSNSVQVAASGLSAEQAVGHHCYEVVFGRDKPCENCIVLKSIRSGEIEAGEVVTPDNKNIWIKAFPVRNGAGIIIGAVEATQDVTEQRRIEEQLRQSQKMEAIGHLAGGVAHDMNNILAAVMGSASALGLELDSAEANADLENILEACRKGAQLTQNLLGFARKGKYVKKELSLNDAVEQVNQLLKHSLSKKIVFKTDLDESLELIEGDLNQIENAIMNISLNALDAMEGDGELKITTRNIHIQGSPRDTFGHLPPGRYVKLEVRDSGSGMSAQTKAQAFDPFFTTKRQGEGTGLGLSMVWGVVKNHGGTVTMDSKLGDGTTVTIFLPATRPGSAEVDSVPPARMPSSVPGRGGILVVDDEEVTRNTIQRMAQRLGYWVFLAKDGGEALDVFEKNCSRIDLVFLDIIMPVMDGVDAFDELKKLDPDVKILLSSGFTEDSRVDGLLVRGALGFIPKPFDIELLAAELKRVLELA